MYDAIVVGARCAGSTTRPVASGPRSVSVWTFDMIDGPHLHGGSDRFQFQPELGLERGEDVGAVITLGR